MEAIMAIFNLSLTDLTDISFVQVGYDSDGRFDDYTIDWEYLVLTGTVSVDEATFSATNAVEGGITRINVIKLIHQNEDSSCYVLAYRTTDYTIEVVPSNDAEITVHVTLTTNAIGEQEGTIDLNYLSHTKQLPKTVHNNIDNLPFQTIDTVSDTNFPSILTTDTSNTGVSGFDLTSESLQRSYGTPAYCAGRGKTYSNLLWYYWNVDKISSFLTTLASKFTGNLATYTASLPRKLSLQNPMLGFNARYGSYLYWYNISTDYICVIYVGSNHYNAIDIFITENTENIQPHECVFWNEQSKQFRIKINRWYNHLYFVVDNKAYQINTNLDVNDGISIYSQNIEEPFAYENDIFGDVLKYSIRAFRPDITDAIRLKAYSLYNPPFPAKPTSNVKYWQLEFADIGDILCFSYEQEGQQKIAIQGIFDETFNALSDNGDYSWTVNDAIDAPEFGNINADYPVFNQYTIDNMTNSPRIWGLYQTSLVHLQYFLKNDYTPLYLGEEYSIGFSNIYHNYITLFKVPTVANRRRCEGNWLEDTCYIEQGKIGHSGGFVENIYTGDVSEAENQYLAAERGVCLILHKNGIGAYRNIGPEIITPTATIIDFSTIEWKKSGASTHNTNYDAEQYHLLADIPDYTKLSLRFTDALGQTVVLLSTGLQDYGWHAIYSFETPDEGVYSRMRLMMATDPGSPMTLQLSFGIDRAFRENYPMSSEFASQYFEPYTYQVIPGCKVEIWREN